MTEALTLTPAQQEVMELVWAADPEGVTVADLWEAIKIRRDIARTTVLTTVQRLEKSGWLARSPGRHGDLWRATRPPEAVREAAVRQFVDRWFEGSASKMVQCLLGGRRVKKAEIARLRELLREGQDPS